MKEEAIMKKVEFFRKEFKYNFNVFDGHGIGVPEGELDDIFGKIDEIVERIEELISELRHKEKNFGKIEWIREIIYRRLTKEFTPAFYRTLKGHTKSEKEAIRKEWADFRKYSFYKEAVDFFKNPFEFN